MGWCPVVRRRRVSGCDQCSYPIRQFIVSHDGIFLQCCMTFKGRPAENTRSGATVCNLADYPSIFEAYTSPGMTAWRLIAFTTKAKHGSCGTCPGFDPHEAEAAPLADYARSNRPSCQCPEPEVHHRARTSGSGHWLLVFSGLLALGPSWNAMNFGGSELAVTWDIRHGTDLGNAGIGAQPALSWMIPTSLLERASILRWLAGTRGTAFPCRHKT